ncbi:Paired amphipathic helix protein Sin3b [Parelaphostrongylus tenuis]|uniref:Paired amphipathic helix protein Sin3b n=1 Tax=Parelaphostrongylus tenuis TaxID=148309 RepID=A0AAD5M4N4_PARTN|nr:Paired amphipathic helix protein Sin3b [Parelaphostrongylus tenuis]
MYGNCGSSGSTGNVYDQYDINAHGMNQNRVKVEDALSYLDQVKTQFADQPNVYTQFLDIMKDFKSQAIDTPGVITRVSRLFQGRSALIMGFNTFLPPGFEVRVVGSRITIMEPSGNTQVILNNPAETERLAEEKDVGLGNRLVQADQRTFEHSMEDTQNIPTPAALAPSPGINTSIGTPNRQDINEAIGYVNRIKARFANKPIVYKKFLDILHTYQRTVDKQSRAPQREKAVLDAVTSLFGEEPDLLEEFRHFLPGVYGLRSSSDMLWDNEQKEAEVSSDSEETFTKEELSDSEHEQQSTPKRRRRSKLVTATSPSDGSVWKREVSVKDIVLNASVDDIMYFDKIRRCLDERKHDTFLRALNLYSTNIITGSELLSMLNNVFGKQAYLLYGLRRILGVEDNCNNSSPSSTTIEQRFSSDLAHQIDYSSCKQLGVSYRSLPDSFKRPVCSGRTPLCHEVLNDTWVSFPSWSSEDTTHVSSKKTQYEEFIYRTEDERFELDIIIDVNKYAIESLELVRRRMERMTQPELDKFQLDERLGGSSPSLMLRAIKRIYGEHASKITEGIKRNPSITIPKVLDRMRDKEKEWREAQVAMNRIWREQNEKHMMRSLDHQTNALRNSDSKWIKAKSLLHHIEIMFDERQQKSEEGLCEDVGPHIVMLYPEDRSVLHDASNLIIHYVKRQSNIHKEEKNKIKCILRRWVTEWFGVDDEDMSDGEENSDPLIHAIGPPKKRRKEDAPEDEPPKLISTAHYRLVYGGNSLFLFFRVHQMICDRLGKLKAKHEEQIRIYEDELKVAAMQMHLYKIHGKRFDSHEQNASDTNNGLAIIKSPQRPPLSNYSDLLFEIKNLLDGNIDSNTFEDNVRLLFPVDGYLVTTIDKLVAMVGRQLHFLATGSEGLETMRLYQRYRYDKPISVFSQSPRKMRVEEEYSQSAESFFSCQNCFKIFVIYEDKPVVTIELVDTEIEEETVEVENTQPNDDSVAYGSSDFDSDQNEEVEEEQLSEGRTAGVLKPNGLSSTRSSSRLRPLHTSGSRPSARPTVLPVEKCRLFMRRNARIRRPEIAGEFVVVGGTPPPTGCSSSWEGIVRRNRFRGLSSMERMHHVRKSRAGEMFAEEHGVTWLAKGMQKIKSHHPVYTFLQYNRYMLKNVSQSSRA